MDRPSTSAVLKRAILPVYLPVFAVNGGTAMLVPILPLYLRDELGLSYTRLSVILAAAGVGSMLAQVPFGRLLARRSETAVMVSSVVLTAASTVVLGFTGLAVALVLLRFLSGVGSVGWILSRQTFLTRTINPLMRGRAMSIFGGTTRAAFLAGPLASGSIADRFDFTVAFAATAAVTLAGLLPLLFWRPSPVERSAHADTSAVTPPPTSLTAHRRTLAIAGAGQLCILAVRQGRFVVLPLIGAAIGMNVAAIGQLVAIGSFADLALFPVAGYTMDRFGRLAAIVPSFGLLGIGLFLLAIADSATAVSVAAVVIGIGNGMGSGTMLTLSSDLAPVVGPSQFLAAMGTIRDAGKIVGPLAVGALADSAGLSTAASVLGVVAFVAIAVIAIGVGETRGRPAPT